MAAVSVVRPLFGRSARGCSRSGLRAGALRSGAFTLFVLAFAVFEPLFGVIVSAQTPPPPDPDVAAFQGCMRTEVNRVRGEDSNEPGPVILLDPASILKQGLECAHRFADAFIVEGFARPLLNGITIIMVVWTGVMMMFSGRFDFAQLLSFILLLGFAHMLMDGFETDGNWWGDRSFPQLIYEQGEFVAGGILESSRAEFFNTVAQFWNSIWSVPRALFDMVMNTDGENSGFVARFIQPYVSVLTNYMGTYVNIMMSILMFALISLPVILLYCSYLWAYVGLMVAVIIGPIFIPFVLVPQLDWLFWSWIKSLFKLTIHMMIGAVIFSISVQLALLPIRRATAALESPGALTAEGTLDIGGMFATALGPLFSIVSYLAIVILLWIASTKTAEMASMVTEGGGMPASGFSSMVGQASGMAKNMGMKGGLAGGMASGASNMAGSLGGAAAKVGGAAGQAAAAAAKVISGLFKS